MIYAPEGVHIYLDGDFVGITGDEGLYLYNVEAGMHSIEAKKRAFDTWRRDMRLTEDGKTEVYVQLKRPAKSEGLFGDSLDAVMPTGSGSLLLRSSPERCQIIFDGETYEKKRSSLLIEGIVPGKYWIRFNKGGYESLTTIVDMQKGCMIRMDADFIRGEIDRKTECSGDPLRQDPDPRGEKIIIVPDAVPLSALQGDSLIDISWSIFNGSNEMRTLTDAISSAPYIVFPDSVYLELPPGSARAIKAKLYTREIEGFRGEYPVFFIVNGINITSTGFEIIR